MRAGSNSGNESKMRIQCLPYTGAGRWDTMYSTHNQLQTQQTLFQAFLLANDYGIKARGRVIAL